VNLKLVLSGTGVKLLKKAKGQKLKLKLTITFQPNGGSPATTTKTLIFKKAGARH
jgi:hypothetical protein